MYSLGLGAFQLAGDYVGDVGMFLHLLAQASAQLLVGGHRMLDADTWFQHVVDHAQYLGPMLAVNSTEKKTALPALPGPG